MIALLDVESMWIDVEGEKGKSHGMIGCALIIRPNSYDHKRSVQEDAVAAENRTQPLRVWDFIIRRFDGTNFFGSTRNAIRTAWRHTLPRVLQNKFHHQKVGMAKATAQGRFGSTYIRKPKGT